MESDVHGAPALRRPRPMFFSGWSEIGRVAMATAIVFVLVVATLRIVGQQALAKMSGYDVVFTVTLGSIVSTVILTHGVTVSDGATALFALVALQELTRWVQSRWLVMHHAVREPPIVLLWDGQLLEDRLEESHISADEVRAAVRKMGLRSFTEAQVVVLENDGEWSVVPKSDNPSDESALLGLPIPDRPGNSAKADGDRGRPAAPDRVP